MRSKKQTTGTKKDSKPALVPKLRFPEFRDTEEWNTTPLGELGAIVTGKTPSTKEEALWGGEILFITPTDITEDEKYQHTTQRTVVETTGTRVLPPGSIVYTCIASIGKMALTVAPSVTNQQINAVVPNGKTAREFIYYSLANLTTWIKSIPATSTLPIINKTQFSGFIIPHPENKAEQHKIAECLSSVDELIAAQARKVDALKTHKKGLMQQLFPREGETQPRLRFPEFQNTGEWGTTPLDKLLKGSPDYGVNAAAVPFSENLPKYLRITDISEDGRYSPNKKVSVDLDVTDGNYLDEGDIVLVRTGASVGKSYRYRKEDGRLVFAGFLIRIKPDPRSLYPIYLANFLTSDQFWKWVAITSARSGQPGINSTEYKALAIPLPPNLTEQQHIADCLTNLDDLITVHSQKLDALKTHKKWLMQQLFPSAEAVTA